MAMHEADSGLPMERELERRLRGRVQGQMLRLSRLHAVAIYLRDGRMWVADFIDGKGTLVDATTWFRFNCGTLANSHALRRMALESAIPLSEEVVDRIEALHRATVAQDRRPLDRLIESIGNLPQSLMAAVGAHRVRRRHSQNSIGCDALGQSTTAVYREKIMSADKATKHKASGYFKTSLIGLGLIAAGIAAVIVTEDTGRPPHAVAAPAAQSFASTSINGTKATDTRLLPDDYLSSNLVDRISPPVSTPRECRPEQGIVNDCTFQ